jgi:hypothetical protein
MKRKKQSSNLGSAKLPIDFGRGSFAYRRDGTWRYRSPQTARQFGRRFIEVADQELISELETRGYMILNPAHECADRPHLPCPACEMHARRSVLRSA